MVTLDLGVIAVTVLKRPRSVLGLLITIYTQSLNLTWLTALNSIPMMLAPAYIFPSPAFYPRPLPCACPTLGCPRERAQHNMSKTRLLCSLISMKTHSSFSHILLLILWEILLIPYLKYVQNLTSALCSCSHSDVRHHHLSSGLLHEPLCSVLLPLALDPPPHRTLLLAQKPEWSTLNVSPCAGTTLASHCHFAIPRALV